MGEGVAAGVVPSTAGAGRERLEETVVFGEPGVSISFSFSFGLSD